MKRFMYLVLLLLCIFNTSFCFKNYYIDFNSSDNFESQGNIIGKLYIPNTKISNYVVKGSDNSFYLNHDIYDNYDVRGSLFMDYRVNNNDRIIIIYGHNSRMYDIPFQDLEKYYVYDFYKDNRYIYYNDSIYYIFSVFIETNDWSYLNIDVINYLDHYNSLKDKSIYSDDILLSNDDDLLILQTCSYHSYYKNYNKKYLVIVSKKILT